MKDEGAKCTNIDDFQCEMGAFGANLEPKTRKKSEKNAEKGTKNEQKWNKNAQKREIFEEKSTRFFQRLFQRFYRR